MNKLMAISAFLVLVAFLAILLIHVPRVDLTVIIAITVGLAGYDLYVTFRGRSG